MNKKGILIVFLFILTMPVMINASVSYESGVDKSKNYIKRISGYDKFILTNIESGFEYGGLLSKEEFNITKVNGKSYLAIGPQYWLKQASNNKKYVVDFSLREVTNELFSGVRVTEYTKPNVKVVGKGTQSQPWEFINNDYTVKYNANGGTGNMQQTTYEFNKPANLPLNVFTKDGYIFDGWNTLPDGSGTSYPDGALVMNLSNISGTVVTLYAKWKSSAVYSFNYTGNYTVNGVSYSNQDFSSNNEDDYIYFTSSGTFTSYNDTTIDIFTVGGGGGGGAGCNKYICSEGGAGGASVEKAYNLVANTGYRVTVGDGGAKSVYSSVWSERVNATDGEPSSFQLGSTVICSANGGKAGSNQGCGGGTTAGGSGGTGGSSISANNAKGGTGGSTTWKGNGNAGGKGYSLFLESSTNYQYGGGGGGGAGWWLNSDCSYDEITKAGSAGSGGGAAGSTTTGKSASSNTGGGAGGGSYKYAGGAGGSGIVVIRASKN